MGHFPRGNDYNFSATSLASHGERILEYVYIPVVSCRAKLGRTAVWNFLSSAKFSMPDVYHRQVLITVITSLSVYIRLWTLCWAITSHLASHKYWTIVRMRPIKGDYFLDHIPNIYLGWVGRLIAYLLWSLLLYDNTPTWTELWTHVQLYWGHAILLQFQVINILHRQQKSIKLVMHHLYRNGANSN